MFEFLRRRKRYALEQQINKSRNNSKSRCEAATDRVASNQTIDEISAIKGLRQKKNCYMESRDDKFSTLSSKKVTFREPETKESNAGRSFFEIISPFKRRTSSDMINKENEKENRRLSETGKNLKGKEQTLQKKGLLVKLDLISKQIQ